MSIALISTGTELLKGSVVNTNSAFIGRELASAGLQVIADFTIGDHPRELYAALSDALKLADIIVITGGLGPTRDDLSLDAAARFFGLELESDPVLEEKVTAFWHRRHTGRVPGLVLKQARRPADSVVLDNPNGSAGGIAFRTVYDRRERLVVLLPGPPRELEPMVRQALIPLLKSQSTTDREYTLGFLVSGVGEFTIQQQLEKALKEFEIELAYCARPAGTRVFFSGADRGRVEAAAERAHALLSPAALPVGELEMADYVVKLLGQSHLQLVTAESCTGGLIAGRLTDLPGVSEVFKGGVVVYSNELKHRLLGVPEELLAEHGAVSRECAEAMIRGAVSRLEADCAVAVTGIAGPGGGTEAKPVGLVHIGAKLGEAEQVREFRFNGDRRAIRERTVEHAFAMLRELLEPSTF